MLVGTYLNLLVSNGTSGIFSGQGRPLIATILSFGLELPLSIGGVAIYILCFHGNLIGVYWWGAIAAAIEIVIVLYLIVTSDWAKCADEARERQEAPASDDDDVNDNGNGLEDGETSVATTFIIGSSTAFEIDESLIGDNESSDSIEKQKQPMPDNSSSPTKESLELESQSSSEAAEVSNGDSAVDSTGEAKVSASPSNENTNKEEVAEATVINNDSNDTSTKLEARPKKWGKKKRGGKM